MSLNRLLALAWLHIPAIRPALARFLPLGLIPSVLLLSGCLKPETVAAPVAKKKPDSKYTDVDGLPTLIEPFKAPTLAELDQEKKWVAREVVDPFERFKKMVEALPKPIPLKEAREVKNTDSKTNQEIISGFLRVPDENLRADYDAKLSRHLRADVKSTNPVMQNTVQEFDLAGLTAMYLTTFDWNLEPFPNAYFVKSWDSSEDGLCERVVLRDDISWSDGKPLTAHDVAYTFRIILCPTTPIPGVRAQTEEIRWVEAYDDQTLVIFHKKALATNIWNCEFPILPKHIYEKTWPEDLTLLESKANLKYEENPVVAGPYVLEKWTRRQELVLKRNEHYYLHKGKQVRPKPYFAEVRFKVIEDPSTTMLALKRGDIEEYEMSVTQWNSQASDDEFYRLNTKARESEWTYFYFGWNNRHELFNDRRVREAMAYAYPHHVLLDGLNRKLTEPCLGLFHPTSPMFPRNKLPIYTQDLRKADELLKAAGWVDTDGDNILDKEVTKLDRITGKPILDEETKKPITYRRPFEFTMYCTTDPLRIATCNLMKNSLEKLGIVCNVRPLEQTVVFKREMEHDFDAYFGGWGSGSDPDTSSNIWTTKAINDGRNFIGYSNPFVDGLFELAQHDPTSKAARQEIFEKNKLGEVGVAVDSPRMEIYQKIHELIYQDQPTTFLYYRNAYFGFSKKLLGYHFSPRGPYHYSPGFSSIWKAVEE